MLANAGVHISHLYCIIWIISGCVPLCNDRPVLPGVDLELRPGHCIVITGLKALPGSPALVIVTHQWDMTGMADACYRLDGGHLVFIS